MFALSGQRTGSGVKKPKTETRLSVATEREHAAHTMDIAFRWLGTPSEGIELDEGNIP